MSRRVDTRSNFGPTLESGRLPVVGAGKRAAPTAWHAFWLNLALVLLATTIVRLVMDLAL